MIKEIHIVHMDFKAVTSLHISRLFFLIADYRGYILEVL